jgi:hypothetical protein
MMISRDAATIQPDGTSQPTEKSERQTIVNVQKYSFSVLWLYDTTITSAIRVFFTISLFYVRQEVSHSLFAFGMLLIFDCCDRIISEYIAQISRLLCEKIFSN